MFQQRLFTIATGYEDLNDHKRMCSDVTLQTAVGGFNLLACTATLAAMDLEAIIQSHRPFWEQFIAGHRQPPKRIGHRYTLHGDMLAFVLF